MHQEAGDKTGAGGGDRGDGGHIELKAVPSRAEMAGGTISEKVQGQRSFSNNHSSPPEGLTAQYPFA